MELWVGLKLDYLNFYVICLNLLQIHLNTSSNANLNYKFMTSLTSQTRQHKQLHLSVIFQREDQVRTETIIRNRQQPK
jgi:hypothetical protein